MCLFVCLVGWVFFFTVFLLFHLAAPIMPSEGPSESHSCPGLLQCTLHRTALEVYLEGSSGPK